MFCREAYKLLSLYLDGLVEESQVRHLETHLEDCIKCRGKLDLMKQIPEVLQSDRLLAPSEDFTKLVMQRVVMQQVVVSHSDQNGSSYSSYSRTTVTYGNSPARQAKTSKTKAEPEDEQPDQTAKIVSFEARRPLPRQVPGTYLLRFSSMAAAFVLSFGLLAYLFEINGAANVSSDTSGRAVMALADLLTTSFASPWQVAIGAIVAAVIIVTLWLQLVRLRNKSN